MEDGGFADAGGEGGEVRGDGCGEGGGGGGDLVAEAVEVFLCGGDGAGGEELLEPDVERGVFGVGGWVAEEGEEGGAVVGAQGEVEEDEAVGFAFAEIEAGAGAAFETEGVGEIVLDLVGGTETGEGISDRGGELVGEAGEGGDGLGGEGKEGAGFGLGHFFVGGQGGRGGVEIDFGGLSGRGFAQGGGEEWADAGQARGEGGGLGDEEGAEVDGLAVTEGAPDAGAAAAHFVIVLHIIEHERGVVQEFDRGGESNALFGRELEAVGEVDGEAGTDAFAGAFEKVGGGLAETAGGAGGVGEDLFDEREVVAAGGFVGAGGRHGERAET